MGQEVVSRQSSSVGQRPEATVLLSTQKPFLLETGKGRPGVSGDRGLESWLAPGRILGLIGSAGSGLTSIGISLLAQATVSEPVAVLDVRGWFCPSLAWEAGIEPERLVIVRCHDPAVWPKLAATLVEGFTALYAEVPRRVPDQVLRRIGALARSRRTSTVMRAMEGNDLPTGLLHLRIEGVAVKWEGPESGHGRLQRRAVTVRASGKGTQGIERLLEVEGDGTDTVRLVSRLAAPAAGRATG